MKEKKGSVFQTENTISLPESSTVRIQLMAANGAKTVSIPSVDIR